MAGISSSILLLTHLVPLPQTHLPTVLSPYPLLILQTQPTPYQLKSLCKPKVNDWYQKQSLPQECSLVGIRWIAFQNTGIKTILMAFVDSLAALTKNMNSNTFSSTAQCSQPPCQIWSNSGLLSWSVGHLSSASSRSILWWIRPPASVPSEFFLPAPCHLYQLLFTLAPSNTVSTSAEHGAFPPMLPIRHISSISISDDPFLPWQDSISRRSCGYLNKKPRDNVFYQV